MKEGRRKGKTGRREGRGEMEVKYKSRYNGSRATISVATSESYV